jgi:hypothetical protein
LKFEKERDEPVKSLKSDSDEKPSKEEIKEATRIYKDANKQTLEAISRGESPRDFVRKQGDFIQEKLEKKSRPE